MNNQPRHYSQPTANGRFRRWRRTPIRWRLTIWYASSVCLLLLGFSILVWTMTSSWLLQRTDAELVEELAELQTSVESSADENEMSQSVAQWSQLHEPYGFDYEIRSVDGALLMRSRRLTQYDASLTFAGGHSTYGVRSGEIDGIGTLRVKAVHIEALGESLQIRVALSLAEQQRLLHQLAIVLLMAGLVVMAGAAGGGYFLSRRALRPVDEMTRTAARISVSQFDERIAVDNPHDELGRLAQTLNTMLDRLDHSFGELKRFTADAAHELRTPLALLRNELEVCLRTPRSANDYEKTLRNALDDTCRMGRLVEQLLELARGDADSRPVATDPVPLAALMTDVVSELETHASRKDTTIEFDDNLACRRSDDEASEAFLVNGVAVSGDCAQLRRLFVNLLDNAVKYTPAGGHVRVCADTSVDAVRITINDSGVGIPVDQLPRVFDRFYRCDTSRATRTGGTGLGLSICRSIVEKHGGTIDINSSPGHGTQITVSLPVFVETV